MLALLALGSLSALAPQDANALRLTVPGTDVQVRIAIQGFRAEEQKAPRALLLGSCDGGATVSVLFEPNFPFVGGAECVQSTAKDAHPATFDAGGVPACEFESSITGGVTQRQFYAFASTPDFVYTFHVSRIAKPGASDAKRFEREDFVALVKSFAVEGRVDVATLPFPPEVYAVRDRAAQAETHDLAWCTKQCDASPNDWALHYYLGACAYERDDSTAMLRGYGHASELLGKKTGRTPKETHAYVNALDACSYAHFGKKSFADALAACKAIVAAVPEDSAAEIAPYREQAQYHAACCHAQLGHKEEALKSLRAVLASNPKLKAAAQKDELLKPLRGSSAFQELVK